jgi:hypothetical protein
LSGAYHKKKSREHESSSPLAVFEEDITFHALYQLVDAHYGFVVVDDWKNRAGIKILPRLWLCSGH